MAETANLTAIVSGNETIGKTRIAVGLAESFAAAGEKVLLLDTDIGFGKLSEYLKVTPDVDLYDVLYNRATLNQAIIFSPEGGFDVIIGSGNSKCNIAAIPESNFFTLRNDILLLAGNYDRVIIDMPTGESKSNFLLLDASKQIVLIANDHAPSIRGAYAFMVSMAERKILANMAIAVNLAATEKDGETVYLTLQKAAKAFIGKTPKWLGNVRKDNLDDILSLAKELGKWTL
ncbi:MAG: AAA family ATPase [Alphaproteobacteria bacterium]|nr:AAA family ATPase [Alphaproteobacteria bacterium]